MSLQPWMKQWNFQSVIWTAKHQIRSWQRRRGESPGFEKKKKKSKKHWCVFYFSKQQRGFFELSNLYFEQSKDDSNSERFRALETPPNLWRSLVNPIDLQTTNGFNSQQVQKNKVTFSLDRQGLAQKLQIKKKNNCSEKWKLRLIWFWLTNNVQCRRFMLTLSISTNMAEK